MKYYKTTIYLPDATLETWVNFTDDEIVKFAEFEKEAREGFIKDFEETPEENPEDWKDYLCDFYQEKEYIIRLEINGYEREVVVYGVDLENPIEED